MSQSTAAAKTTTRAMRPRSAARTQAGVALLGLIVFIAIVTSVFIVRSLNADTLRSRIDQRTTDALAAAREALLAYATTDDVRPSGGGGGALRPGSLPCPDSDGDGAITVGPPGPLDITGDECTVYLGRVPWVRLGIPPPRDGAGEVIWYALSRQFRDAGRIENTQQAQPFEQGGMINPDAVGRLALTDQATGNVRSGLVAVLFAAGPVVAAQNRSGVSNDPLNFLDGSNGTGGLFDGATGITTFVQAPAGPNFNDRLAAITVGEMIERAERRVLGEVSLALQDYFQQNQYVPPPGLFSNVQCVDWGVTNGCASVPGLGAGRVPATVGVAGQPWALPDSLFPNRLLSSLRNAGGQALWFQAQRWREHVIYIPAPGCTTLPRCTTATLGTLQVRGPSGLIATNAAFVLLAAGPAGGGQLRTTSTLKGQFENYLEGSALKTVELIASGATVPEIVVPPGTAVLAWTP
jgi:hypothetical protein